LKAGWQMWKRAAANLDALKRRRAWRSIRAETWSDDEIAAIVAEVTYPRVTVVIPAYNEEQHLDACIRSVLTQSMRSVECLVVDDTSTDSTLDIACDWAGRDDRVKVFRHPVNRGLAASRNSGLQMARGRFITFLDGDDFLFPESLATRLETLTAALEDAEEVIGSYCDWEPVEADTTRRYAGRPAVVKPDVNYLSAGGEIPFVATAPMLDTDRFRALGGFAETFRTGEDYECWMRVLRHGYRFVYTPTVGVAYRQRRDGMLQSSPASHARAAVAVMDWQNERLTEDTIVPGTPYVYREPISFYEQQARTTRRLIASLALAVFADDDSQCSEILAMVPTDPPPALPTVLDIEKAAARSLARVGRANPNISREALDSAAVRTAERLSAELVTRRSISSDVPGPSRHSSPLMDRLPPTAVVEPVIVDVVDSLHRLEFGGVVLVPMARYHVEEFMPLAAELSARGLKTTWLLTRFFPEEIRVEMRRHGVERLFSWPADLEDLPPFDAAVMLNDWGPTKELVTLAESRGMPTFAKVEGVQDFEDADTGRPRHAYRRAAHILCQGENDVVALPDMLTTIVGSSRLERLAAAPERSFVRRRPLVVVNSNFTYNVLTEHRDAWVRATVAACEKSDLDVVISQHHADGPLPADVPCTRVPMKVLLHDADILISRFSTVPFEAMAMGVPFVYFNPHGETVPTFLHPDGAFPMATDEDSLGAALQEALSLRGRYRAHASGFFSAQVDVSAAASSASRTADAIAQSLDR
ncbi:MAG: glycosyltransferase, partial [Acidimicrobiaceae bacterium]|nr:glycosyltransferase [Acidimicrobiaceae bacterium]